MLFRIAIDGERALVFHVVALENSLDRPVETLVCAIRSDGAARGAR